MPQKTKTAVAPKSIKRIPKLALVVSGESDKAFETAAKIYLALDLELNLSQHEGAYRTAVNRALVQRSDLVIVAKVNGWRQNPDVLTTAAAATQTSRPIIYVDDEVFNRGPDALVAFVEETAVQTFRQAVADQVSRMDQISSEMRGKISATVDLAHENPSEKMLLTEDGKIIPRSAN